MNTQQKTPADAGSLQPPCSADLVMELIDPVHRGPIRAVHEQDYDHLIAMMRKLHATAVACYSAAFDYASPPRERDVLQVIHEAEEFLSPNMK